MDCCPLVSVITPTFNRREFFPRAVECFLAYDYPRLEWVILDDGTDSIVDLVPIDKRVRYIRQHSKSNHGQKMNALCTIANGEYAIIHDDDDIYPSDRVTRQIAPLLEGKAVSGSSSLYYYTVATKKAYRYSWPDDAGDPPWIGAIAFSRSVWLRSPFKAIPAGADLFFLRDIPRTSWADLKDPSLAVCAIHDYNAEEKKLDCKYYHPVSWETINA